MSTTKSITWQDPVVNRSQTDIDGRTPHAYLNKGDLNRIEGNIKWLTDRLNEFLFFVQTQSKTNWKEEDIPITDDIRRVCENITEIKKKYYRPSGYTDVPNLENKNLHYTDVNLWETNLYLFKRLHDCMVDRFKKPSFKSGAKLLLLKGRK